MKNSSMLWCITFRWPYSEGVIWEEWNNLQRYNYICNNLITPTKLDNLKGVPTTWFMFIYQWMGKVANTLYSENIKIWIIHGSYTQFDMSYRVSKISQTNCKLGKQINIRSSH